ncbi:MAG: Mitochondrial presequence protease [Caeruleum heppii]|nr:MAG: Mitochondrial presequence protease [Caeruleum heppii]
MLRRPATAGRQCRQAARPHIHLHHPARRRYASVTSLDHLPQPGDTLHGFTLKRRKHVPELQLTALHLEHDKSGAEHLHVARDDKNNVFSIAFKTNPPDHTGLPHILEHVTLCGSERYPVRDPFFKMLPRTLSNFMNAFTSSDYTSYPFATTNPQDFKNLMSVYADATLHPLLGPSDFAQEGWRIGPENPQQAIAGSDPSQAKNPLIFKGVVYNEMKGQMSDNSYLYYIRFQEHMFPAINNSGGDPQRMTDLTHPRLTSYHAAHYHPSNARLFTYGDMPVEQHLRDLSSYLDGFERKKPPNDIKEPAVIEGGPKYVVVKGPFDNLVDANMQHKTSTSWILGDTSNILETFSLGIISSLLLDGYGSPMYRALIEAGLGSDFSPNTGFDSSSKRGIFSVGLSGVKTDAVPSVKDAIHKTLQDVYDKGFDQSKIDGLLHQLELGLKHKTANFGMALMQRIQPGWFNGVDPFDALKWDEVVTDFKAALAGGRYLENLLQKFLLNDNTLTFTMEPSASYRTDQDAEESSRLREKIAETSARLGSEKQALEHFQKQELALVELQQEAQDRNVEKLPTLHVRDIPRQMEMKPTRDVGLKDVQVQWRAAPTNGLTYFRAINTFEGLSAELRMYMPLFTDAIMRLGTRSQSMEQLEDLIKLKTGGVRSSYHTSNSPNDIDSASEGLLLSGYALDRNVPAMYELLRTLLLETDFDGPQVESHLRQLLQGDAGDAVNRISGSGHAYARRFAESGLTPQGRLSEQIAGLTQVKLSAQLASRSPEEGLGDVVAKLKAIQQFAITRGSGLRAAITCGPESVDANTTMLQKFVDSLPVRPSASPSAGTSVDISPGRKILFPLPFQVYHSALALRTVPYTHPTSATFQILAQLLTHKHLHGEIREKGGAYGGGAYAKGLGGLFGFYSYRDPDPVNSMKIMNDALEFATQRHWSEREIEEAKLSVFQGLDAPESVSEEGMTRFLSGVTDEMQQRHREQLLDVQAKDVSAAAEAYKTKVKDEGVQVVLGEQADWVTSQGDWIVRELGVSSSVEAES